MVNSQALLQQLEDDIKRCFLSAMSLDWQTAEDLSRKFDTPLSTTYRKLNALDDAGFLEQRIRLSPNGKHPEEFRCKPMSLAIRVGGPMGLEFSVNAVTPDAPWTVDH